MEAGPVPRTTVDIVKSEIYDDGDPMLSLKSLISKLFKAGAFILCSAHLSSRAACD